MAGTEPPPPPEQPPPPVPQPPQQQPSGRPPPGWAPPPAGGYGHSVAQPVWRSLRGLATALTILLCAVACLSVVFVVALANRIGVANDLESGTASLGDAEDADSFVQSVAGLYLLLVLAVAVVFIVWFYRAAKNNEALGRESPRLGPGWAIGGWFIPLANLVIPVLIAQDLWRGSDPSIPRGAPWRQARGSLLVGWWWGAFVVSGLVGRGANAGNTERDTLDDLKQSDSVLIFGTLVSIAAAALAIQVVRKLTTRQDECLRAQQNAAQAVA